MSLTKDLSSQFTTRLFHYTTSRDLRSHRIGYHYSKFQVGLKPISLDALSITLRDRPLPCVWLEEPSWMGWDDSTSRAVWFRGDRGRDRPPSEYSH